MGALNRLDLKKNITPSTERWLAFVKATPAIEGVNIHPHVPKIELSKAFLDYILPRMRPEQTFIVPEFSLVGWWQQIGRASCRERVCQYVLISVVDVSLKKT